ncbi:MAG TPA: hypothetical protein DCG19_08540, partial [Cryomorphaceae bacterium]|nr:hypothetical protein [Cryomorphaceae bacterium]
IDESVLFKRDGIQASDDYVALADHNYFKVFEIPFLAGNPATALDEPQSMVVTRSFAQKYFGDANPVGKLISTNNYEYTVTGLIDDFPANTHHSYSALILSFYRRDKAENWQNSLWQIEAHTFLKLSSAADAARLENDFGSFYQKYMAEAGQGLQADYLINLTPLDEVHFAEPVKFDRPAGNKGYLYAFGGIGLLILVLACINYINMATIRSLRRVKEAGMQKVLGAGKREIVYQVLIESFILASMALLVAMVMVELVLEFTPLNNIMGKDLTLNFMHNLTLWWLPLGLASLIAFLSGWFPALYLSKVPAMAGLKKGIIRQKGGLGVRKLLVGFQFTISVAVVITALLMYRQMEFVRSKDLGFNKEDVMLIPIRDTLTARTISGIRQKLAQSPYIKASSSAQAIPGKSVDRIVINVPGVKGTLSQQVVDFMMVGEDYFKTMEIEFVEGHTFSEQDEVSNTYPVIINEATVRMMGWKNPVGQKIEIVAPGQAENYMSEVIGVVKDFNAHSLHQDIEPTIITFQDEIAGYLHVRVDSKNLISALNDVEKTFAQLRPGVPFQFSFLNKDLMKLYEEEQRQSRLILFLTYLAIFISFLGLTGLASFTTNLKTQEVGIRKVLGAGRAQVVNLIFKEMLWLIVVSVALALPLAYWLTRAWLSNFAYTTELHPLVFVSSGLTAILLAYFIISYHSIKIARIKPVDTLKYE